jgi:hypothetical protein
MRCEEAREALELSADGALEGPAEAALRAHLGACEACADYAAFAAGVGAAMAAARRRGRREAQRPSRARGLSRLAAAVAAVAIGAASFVSVEALRAWRDTTARTEALRAAERALASVLAGGVSGANVGERRFFEGGAGGRTVVVRVSGGPDLFEIRATVEGPAADGGAAPVELTAISGRESVGGRGPEEAQP